MTLFVCLGLGALTIVTVTLAAIKRIPRQGRARRVGKITSTP